MNNTWRVLTVIAVTQIWLSLSLSGRALAEGSTVAPNQLTIRSDGFNMRRKFRSQPLTNHRPKASRSLNFANEDFASSNTHFTNQRGGRSRTIHQANSLSLELGGKGLVYSLAYERSFSPYATAGVGFSYLGITADAGDLADAQATIYLIPVYVNLYYNFQGEPRHRLFGTGGITLTSVSISAHSDAVTEVSNKLGSDMELDLGVGAGGTFPFPLIGAGYEFKSSTNFLVRLSAYGIYTYDIFPQAFNLWAGIAAGVTF